MSPNRVQFVFGTYQELFQSLQKNRLDDRVARLAADVFQKKIFLVAGVNHQIDSIVEAQPEQNRSLVRDALQAWVWQFAG